MYYFDNPYKEMFANRIVCVDGDITSKEDVSRLSEYKFRTLINCAACVKHFATGDVLEKINVTGVENLIDLCKNNARRLIQISTVSVGGEGSDGTPPMSRVFCENDLYIGQNITCLLYTSYNDGNVRMAVTEDEVVESWKSFFNRGTNWKDFPQVTSYEEYQKITDKQHLSKAKSMPIKLSLIHIYLQMVCMDCWEKMVREKQH